MPEIEFTQSEIKMMKADPTYGVGWKWWEIQAEGFRQLVDDINSLEDNWNKESARVLAKAARELRRAAQPRSPYLYGVLRAAHFDTLLQDSSFWEGQAGLVAIDPQAVHHILGGRPNIYGAEIHAGLRGEHRPWFAQTLERQGQSIIEESGDELTGIYSKYLDRVMSGAL